MLVTGARGLLVRDQGAHGRSRGGERGGAHHESDDDSAATLCGNADVVAELADEQEQDHLHERDDQGVGADGRQHRPGGKRGEADPFQQPHLAPHDEDDGKHVEARRHHAVGDEAGHVVVDQQAAADGVELRWCPGARAEQDEEDDRESDREDRADGFSQKLSCS